MRQLDKRVIICGPAASGKDYLRDAFKNKGYRTDVSYTTRPIRTGEKDGKTYYYVNRETFELMIEGGTFYQWVEFNGWYYGTTQYSWNNSDVFIMTPKGISNIETFDIDDCFIVYLNPDEETRRYRLSLRDDADSAQRRINADGIDFIDFFNHDFYISNPYFDSNVCIDEIIEKQAIKIK